MMDRQTLEVKISEFIADAADVPPERIGLNDNLYKDLGVDSLGSAMLFVDLAYEFSVPEPKNKEEYIRLDTPQKLIDYVLESLG